MVSLHHPDDLKYSKTDEWVRIDGEHVVIGISDYAQDQLGDIVYIDLPWETDQTVTHEEKFGDIESVKATSELISPLSGTVIKSNDALKTQPELINDSPYDQGWMLVIKPSRPDELAELMDAEHYVKYLQGR